MDGITELLANGQHQHLLPKLLAHMILDPKRPRATMDVSRILPDGLHAAFEEMDAVPHLEILQRQLVEALPKRFDRDDGFQQRGQTLLVRGGGVDGEGALFMVEGPSVAERRGADLAVHVEFESGAVVGGGGDGGRVGGFGNPGETVDLQFGRGVRRWRRHLAECGFDAGC